MKVRKKMGKCFSGVNRGQRKASDFYETPYLMTQSLLDVELFDKTSMTLEPACGAGAIVKVLRENGFTDVNCFDVEVDFLQWDGRCKNLITNPPFSLAKEFIIKSKEVVEEKFALLLPLSYLHGKARLDMVYSDRDFPLSKVYVFCRYPMLGDNLRPDGKYRTGMMVYAWFVWEKTWTCEPHIRWIDNQDHIIKKSLIV